MEYAPREAGVRRVVFYSVGKLFGEHAGRLFSDRYGMSVLIIRIGAVLAEDRPSIVASCPGFSRTAIWSA